MRGWQQGCATTDYKRATASTCTSSTTRRPEGAGRSTHHSEARDRFDVSMVGGSVAPSRSLARRSEKVRHTFPSTRASRTRAPKIPAPPCRCQRNHPRRLHQDGPVTRQRRLRRAADALARRPALWGAGATRRRIANFQDCLWSRLSVGMGYEHNGKSNKTIDPFPRPFGLGRYSPQDRVDIDAHRR